MNIKPEETFEAWYSKNQNLHGYMDKSITTYVWVESFKHNHYSHELTARLMYFGIGTLLGALFGYGLQ